MTHTSKKQRKKKHLSLTLKSQYYINNKSHKIPQEK
jgi:hypothetical protein